jgi:hypothetical protein
MNSREVAMVLSDMDTSINKIVVDVHQKFELAFKSSNMNNESVSKEASAHEAMFEYMIAARIAAYWVKNHGNGKKRLDHCMIALGIDNDGQPGKTINLHESNVFEFIKRRNKDSQQMSSTDLLNALARLGVEKAVVDEAVKIATKPRKGNTYYEVSVVEG